MTSTVSIETTPNAAPEHLLIVEVRGQLFGFEATYLREVIPARAATRIPGAPPQVKGLINLRGSLIVVADVAMRLLGEDGAGPAGDDGSIALVEWDGKSLGLAVQDVRDVVALEVEPIEGTGTAMLVSGQSPPASLCRGVGRLEGEIVIVLDVAALARQVVA
ncbi:MAG: chemotaxis protein CheW [Gemmatimonadaceae bacterium]